MIRRLVVTAIIGGVLAAGGGIASAGGTDGLIGSGDEGDLLCVLIPDGHGDMERLYCVTLGTPTSPVRR